MPDKITSSDRIICRGGLNTSENFLMLSDSSPGSAVNLVNFETSLTGGYRRINGFTEIEANLAAVTSVADPAEGPVLGVWGYKDEFAGTFKVIAARKQTSGATYKFYYFTTATGWTAYNTGTSQVSTGVTRIRAEIFSTAADTWIVFVDGVNKALAHDGTTWYQLSSGNAGGAGSPGGNQVLDKPAVVTYFKGSVFFSGDPTAPSVVAYSAPDDPLTWTAAAGGGQVLPGFKVMQIKPFRDENYIFGNTAIRKAIPDVAAGFVLQDVTNNIGCIARDSVAEVGGNLIFLGPDGIRPVAGTSKIGDVELSLLSQSIQNTVKNIVETYDLADLVNVTIRTKQQFRYFISDTSVDTDQAYGLLGCARNYDQGTTWEFGELFGIQANTAWSGYDEDGLEIVLHGDYDGSVFLQEVGSSFNDADIVSVCTFPYLDMGDTEIRKTFRNFNLFVRGEGDVELNVGVAYDWARTDVLNPANYALEAEGGGITFDSGHVFDDGSVFAGSIQPVFNTDIQGSGFSIQFSVTDISQRDPFTLQGFVIEYTVRGRD